MRAYSKRGARGATRRLLDAVRASMRERGTADFTHLDIGGGVGVLQHELARDGALLQTPAVDAARKARVLYGIVKEGLNLDRDDPGLLWCVRLSRRAAA